MRRVFVSYSRRNKNFAERLARDLSDAGLDVWVDWRQIQAGELWQKEIYRGIERSEMLIFCLSPDAVISEWCQREINTARQQGKIIIPVMAVSAMAQLQQTEAMRWLLDVHFINFENRYEEAFPELLNALPGLRRVGAYDDVDPAKIPNPFKGLEAFQQTDSHFFFGREELIRNALNVLSQEHAARFLAVVGASGSGKSSLVRAGIIPEIRSGTLPDSDEWPVVIFAPGGSPVDALAQRLAPLREDMEASQIERLLTASPQNLDRLVEGILSNDPKTARLLLVVDQFEEVFTRAAEAEGAAFLAMLHYAVTRPGGRTQAIITMRADFFDRLGRYPDLARLFEQENLLIVTEMTASDLLRAIEGPAEAVGLSYEEGLPQRILDDVRRQPGSLPLLQYALKELYALRDGRRLTNAAYEKIGGVQRALATHAENIYLSLNAAQQALMRRMLLRLVEVGATGEATRRRVDRNDLRFRDVPDEAVQEVIDLLTAPTSRLLIASREIKASEDDQTAPTVWIEVGHEALIREWKRFTDWVAENVEGLRFGSELLQSANNWQRTYRDLAYLLTGNRLARAEDWLDSGDPTVLQREFIQISLEEDEKRQEAQQEQLKRELSLEAQAAN
ncbi:MAG: toll/interleukin-1 receptor domain-containing protein, partial [Chitinophagaceae bacterium]|nr:toll/interleukin-1 receptor domain-containing protein [Anaerolineae bacterium]